MIRPTDIVYRDDDLTLRWMPGRSRRLVVVFNGIRDAFGGTSADEFAQSASVRGEYNVLFVTDRRVSWFSVPGLWRRLVRLIRSLRTSEGIAEIVTLGNSMGGYAALLLPRDLRVRRAVAFAPQVTMDPAVLRDARWPDVKARWGVLPVRSVAATVPETRTQYYVTAGADCPEDMAHLALLPDLPRVHRFVLPRGRHNPAGGLKRAGLLPEVVAALVQGRKARVERLYDRFGRAVA